MSAERYISQMKKKKKRKKKEIPKPQPVGVERAVLIFYLQFFKHVILEDNC